jgi:hypothetical protein
MMLGLVPPILRTGIIAFHDFDIPIQNISKKNRPLSLGREFVADKSRQQFFLFEQNKKKRD